MSLMSWIGRRETKGTNGSWARRARMGSVGALALVLLFVVGSAQAATPTAFQPTLGHGAGSPVNVASPSAAPTVEASHAAAPSAAPHPAAAPAAPTSSGRATFFNNTVFPSVPAANQSCISSYYSGSWCYNSTSEPSINLTSQGLLAVAYTAFTNITDCPQFQGYGNGSTEVAIRTSSDLGVSWNAPLYLDNPLCTGYDGNFSSAAQPSLTSLANGTLVMAFEEYNITTCPYYYCTREVAPYFYPDYVTYDRIVVSESYDNGSTWTTPTVVSVDNNNSGGNYQVPDYPNLMPRATAFGNTIYVAWTNYTNPYACGLLTGATLRASTNGGVTWKRPVTLEPQVGSSPCYPTTTVNAANPDLIVLPNGTLYVSYLTPLGYACSYQCGESASITVGWSVNNGTTFTYATAATSQTSEYDWCCDDSTFATINPYIVYGASTNQIFVVWQAYYVGNFCEYDTSTSEYCGNMAALAPFIANSSDGGATWNSHLMNTGMTNPNYGPLNAVYNPSIVVTPDGTLHFQAVLMNDTVCGGTYGYCGAIQEVYTNSTDNGTTWSNVVLVSGNYTASYYYYLHPGWPGEYTTSIAIGDEVMLAWTFDNCAITFCDWQYGSPATTGVVVSTLYTGTGLTLSFSETGLTAGTTWSANIMGNVRTGVAPTVLSVSGIPPADLVGYSVPWVNASWGVSYQDSFTPSSPSTFLTSTTIAVSFTEQVLVTVRSLPYFDSYCWSTAGECMNYQMSGGPGSYWVTPGTPQSVTISEVPFLSYCSCTNLSFQSWTGSGPGNYTGLTWNISFTPTGPVNETANFLVLGYCWPSAGICWNTSYYPETFVESGLPANVAWSVTMQTANGTLLMNSSSSSDVLGFLLPATSSEFWVWSIPDPSSGDVWVPTTDVPSPVAPMSGGIVHVTFTLEAASSAYFTTKFIETGLPSGTPWSLEIGGESWGVQANSTLVSLLGGGPYPVNASAVYLENGYGYYASAVSYSSYVENSSSVSGGAPGSLTFDGPGQVTITYSPMYLRTTQASVGGSVSPATGWNVAGTKITLSETPSAGYHFVSWVGSGSGATSTSQDSQTSPTITPTGPVTEAATFRPNPLPTWNLTVVPSGLPNGTAFLVTLGSSTYAGTTSFKIGEITNGDYSVSVPYVYLNGSETTRFVPTTVTSSLTFVSAGVLDVDANGTLTVAYTTQYLLSLAATPSQGGSISPAGGAYWEDLGSAVELTATPATGYMFAGWNGTGSSLVLDESTTLTMTGPFGVTAQFVPRPIAPPAVYWATITEAGLPAGLSWNVSLGAYGAAGPNGTLTVGGLNGSYLLSVPDVTAGPGTRYVADMNGVSEMVTANSSYQVNFTEEFLVTVTAGVGGSVTPAGGTWVPSGTTITIDASPNSTAVSFANWTGTGAGSYTGSGASQTLTVTSPIHEEATFAPVYTPQTVTQGSSSNSMGLALGLLVGLLVVGLVAGLLLGRRGRGGTPSSAPPEEWQEAPTDTSGSEVYAETPTTHEEMP